MKMLVTHMMQYLAFSLLDKSHSNPRWAALYYNYWTNPNNGIMSLIENDDEWMARLGWKYKYFRRMDNN